MPTAKDYSQDPTFIAQAEKAKEFLKEHPLPSKTVVIGDIHGRKIWKDIINKENPDQVIFDGDYFDSFDNTAE